MSRAGARIKMWCTCRRESQGIASSKICHASDVIRLAVQICDHIGCRNEKGGTRQGPALRSETLRQQVSGPNAGKNISASRPRFNLSQSTKFRSMSTQSCDASRRIHASRGLFVIRVCRFRKAGTTLQGRTQDIGLAGLATSACYPEKIERVFRDAGLSVSQEESGDLWEFGGI